jgi:hypothetical protein
LLAVVTGVLWFLAPLIFFGLLFIGNMSFMGYELYQDSFLAKEDSTPSDVPERRMTDVYMFKKMLQKSSLQQRCKCLWILLILYCTDMLVI